MMRTDLEGRMMTRTRIVIALAALGMAGGSAVAQEAPANKPAAQPLAQQTPAGQPSTEQPSTNAQPVVAGATDQPPATKSDAASHISLSFTPRFDAEFS